MAGALSPHCVRRGLAAPGCSPPEPHFARWQARLGRGYLGWRAFTRNPLAVVGLVIVVAARAGRVFADVLAPYSPVVGGDLRTQRLLPPSATYWFGTDDQARDILSRIVYGSRITLCVVALVASSRRRSASWSAPSPAISAAGSTRC